MPSHPAAKLGGRGLVSPERLQAVRLALEQLQAAVDRLAPEHGHAAAPPPLILSAADAPLGRPSLEQLLGSAGLLPPAGAHAGAHAGGAMAGDVDALLDGAEVLGFYFAASW